MSAQPCHAHTLCRTTPVCISAPVCTPVCINAHVYGRKPAAHRALALSLSLSSLSFSISQRYTVCVCVCVRVYADSVSISHVRCALSCLAAGNLRSLGTLTLSLRYLAALTIGSDTYEPSVPGGCVLVTCRAWGDTCLASTPTSRACAT